MPSLHPLSVLPLRHLEASETFRERIHFPLTSQDFRVMKMYKETQRGIYQTLPSSSLFPATSRCVFWWSHQMDS